MQLRDAGHGVTLQTLLGLVDRLILGLIERLYDLQDSIARISAQKL